MEKVFHIKQLLVVGEHDPPEFRRQTREYAQVNIQTASTRFHFTINVW